MKAKYDSIGNNYNRTRKADSYLLEKLIHHLCPKENEKYLDIGCGTGNYTIALCEKGFDFIGVEPSKKMLNQAIQYSKSIEWKSGKAQDIPLNNEVVSGAIATLTIHHWEDVATAFAEISRVLKPKSRFIIFTSNRELMQGYWLNYYFPKMMEQSMKQMPSFEFTKDALEKTGFEIIETEKYFVREDLEDLFLYSGKYNPKIYLDEKLRNGISSFSDLANLDEVEAGLKTLERDISKGKINDIIEQYKNELGDYLYIIAQKNKINEY